MSHDAVIVVVFQWFCSVWSWGKELSFKDCFFLGCFIVGV
uniref:Uncharacterized protein n=1 Tax=Rhizophora mucronata TaxID=61149 RepID=A0A2P2LPN8_RHIMU